MGQTIKSQQLITIVAVTGSAHRGCCPDHGEIIDISSSCIMRSAIRMMDQIDTRSLPLRGHHQGGQWQLGAHVGAHGPTNDFTCCQVEGSGQIKPAFASGDAGDIGKPDPVRRGGAQNAARAGSGRSPSNDGCQSCRVGSDDLPARGYFDGASGVQRARDCIGDLPPEERHAFWGCHNDLDVAPRAGAHCRARQYWSSCAGLAVECASHNIR